MEIQRWFPILLLGLCPAGNAAQPASPPAGTAAAPAGKLIPLDKSLFPDLFVWSDTCNVYVIRDGDDAILIDLGDGGVLDHLGDIGVRNVEWILFTHHHREQCQGYARFKGAGAKTTDNASIATGAAGVSIIANAKIAAPEAERALFERPTSFRKMRPSLGDTFTVYGSSYARPPIAPIRLDRGFAKMDSFQWRAYEFWCEETRGNSPGGMSYMLKRGERWLAFSGDVMLEGARMHDWFDTEWDYGFASGIYPLHASAALLERFDPILLLPSHGPAIREPKPQLREYQDKLRRLENLLVRGYEVKTFSNADQDRTSKPSTVPNVWQVSPHIYKFKGTDCWMNFTLILADSGRALAVDCGLIDVAFLDKAIEGMRERLGLKQIDAAIISHSHGDHILQAPHLRDKWGAQIWTLDRIADKFERPERFDYASPVQAYSKNLDSVRIDRKLKEGEALDWEGYKLTVDWMPGQTEFALCLQGTIDGRKVAFTGDNIFGYPADPKQTGHEAVVAHNSAIFEEGYIYGANYLRRLNPDMIIGGHSFVMDQPAPMIERFQQWALDMRAAFQALSSDDDYRYGYDPFWAHAEPYRMKIKRGQKIEFNLHVRNFRDRPQEHRIAIHAPAGFTAEPAILEGKLEKESRKTFPVRLKAGADAAAGVNIIAFDITLDGRRYGEWFDCVAQVE